VEGGDGKMESLLLIFKMLATHLSSFSAAKAEPLALESLRGYYPECQKCIPQRPLIGHFPPAEKSQG